MSKYILAATAALYIFLLAYGDEIPWWVMGLYFLALLFLALGVGMVIGSEYR